MTDKYLQAALDYAQKGWPVFPCRIDKTPYTTEGVKESTTNLEKINYWWTKWPEANIALDVGAAGMMVLDLDPGHSMSQLEESIGSIPPTSLIQRTPRGGEHLFFELAEGEIIPPSASKLSPKVDVRSNNSYVLLSPSRTNDGEYTWEARGKPGFRSDLMAEKSTGRIQREDHDTWIIEADLPENISKATEWLSGKAKLAIEGEGGDHITYATAAHLKSFGISKEKALELMNIYWNPQCSPPWDLDELSEKVENGYTYNTSPPGNLTESYRQALNKRLFTPVVSPKCSTEVNSGRFRIVDREGMGQIQPPNMLIDDFLPAEAYALLVGAPGTYKTFVALDIALSIALGGGFPWRGTWPIINESGPVLFCVGEGRASITNRVRAWEYTHNNGRKVSNFVLADPVPHVGEDLEPFVLGAKELHEEYKLVVIDTVGRAMQGVNENAQEHASTFTRMVECMQRNLGCTVLGLHHTGHGETSRARGSSVFGADADTIIKLDRVGKGVALKMQKQKDLDEWETKKYIRMEKVELDEDVTSLVAVKTDKPVMEIDREENAKSSILLINAKIIEILKRNPLIEYTNTKLADVLNSEPDVTVGANWLRSKYLPTIKGDSEEYPAAKCYNAMKGRWRYNSSLSN